MSSTSARLWGPAWYLLFFGLGFAPVPWMLPGIVIKNTQHIAIAAALGSVANWSMNFATTYLFNMVYAKIGTYVYLCFAFFCFVQQSSGPICSGQGNCAKTNRRDIYRSLGNEEI